MLSSSLQGMTTVTAFNMQEKLAEDYKQASEVPTTILLAFGRRRSTKKCAGYACRRSPGIYNNLPVYHVVTRSGTDSREMQLFQRRRFCVLFLGQLNIIMTGLSCSEETTWCDGGGRIRVCPGNHLLGLLPHLLRYGLATAIT